MATLSGNKIKNTYQSLVKFSDNGNITVSAKQLTDGFGNNSPMFVSTTQIGIGVTPESGLNLHVFGDAKIGSNLTVIGNLVVEGSTTTVGTDTLTVKDPLIVLANNNTSTDAVDIGFYGKYHPSDTTLYSGLFREALTGKYRLFKGLEVEPTTTVNTSGTGYAVASLVANLEGNVTGNLTGNVTGNITGNVTGGTISGTTGTFSGDVNVNSNFIVTTGTPTSAEPNGSRIIAKIDSSAGNDTGGLEIHTGDNNGDEPALLHTNYNGDEAFRISSLGHIISTGSASFVGQVTIPETPTADTHAASKGYVDAAVEGQDTLEEILANGNTTGGTDLAVSAGDDITFTDTSKSIYGTDGELEIHHNGSNSYITEDGTGALYLQGTYMYLTKSDGSQKYIELDLYNATDSRVKLNYGGANVLTTTSTGITVSGIISGLTDPSAAQDAATKAYVDTQVSANNELSEVLANGNTSGANDIIMADDQKINFGDDSDLQIYSDGTTGFIKGNLDDIRLTNSDDDTIIKVNSNTAELYHNNVKKLSTTTSNGTGVLIERGISINDVNEDLRGIITGDTDGLRLRGSGGSSFSTNGFLLKNNEYFFEGNWGGGVTGDVLYMDAFFPLVRIGDSTNFDNGNLTDLTVYGDVDLRNDLNVVGNSTFSGKVGIGTDSPSNYAKLNVVSSTQYQGIVFGNGTNNVGWISGTSATNDNGQLSLSSAGVQKVQINANSNSYFNGGNVGIGTTSPQQKLCIETNAVSSHPEYIEFTDSGSSSSWAAGQDYGGMQWFTGDATGIGAHTVAQIKAQNEHTGAAGNGALVFSTAPYNTVMSERMRINSSGNVGIGTTTPSTILDISKDYDAKLRITSTKNGTWVDGDNFGSLEFYGKDTSGLGEGIRAAIRAKEQGIYGIDTNLTFSTSNGVTGLDVERMRIDSAGQVGIGTASPGDALVVKGGSPGNIDLVSFQNNAGNETHRFYADSANDGVISTVTNAGVIANLIQSSGNSYFNGGNVGIGTTLPETLLHVKAANGVTGVIKVEGGLNPVTSVNEINSQLDFGSNDGSVNNTGNVGGRIASVTESTNGAAAGMAFSTFQQSRTVDLQEAMRINNAGNVGIGTDTPNQKITIGFADNGTDGISFRSTTYASLGKILCENDNSSTNGNLQFHTRSGGDVLERMRIDSSGKILLNRSTYNFIGTNTSDAADNQRMILAGGGEASPSRGAQLQLYGNEYTGQGGNATLITGGTGYITFLTGSTITERMRIDSAGNVGIGTTSPSFKLDVSGDGIRSIRSTAGWAGWFENTGDSSGVVVTAGSTSGHAPLLIRKEDGTELFSVRGNGTSYFNNGNVGIGTTSPTHLLNLSESDSNSVQLVIDNTNTTDAGTETSEIRFRHYRSYVAGQNDAGEIIVGKEQAWDAAGDRNSYMSFGTRKGSDGVVEKMRIDSSGNVRIGTEQTVFNGNSKLQIARGDSPSYIQFISGNLQEQGILFGDPEDTVEGSIRYVHDGDYMWFQVNNTERMRIDSSGNVTIKAPTASGGGVLNLENTTTAVNGTDWGSLNFISNDSSTSASGIRASVVGTSTSFNGDGNLVFRTAPSNGTNTERMRIDSSGNVGINETSPDAKLDVELTDTNTYSSTALNTATIISQTSNTSNINSQASVISLRATGYQGSTTGVVNLAAVQAGNANSAHFVIQTRNAGAYGERMRIASNGDVGIGDTSPSYKLDVDGTIRATGDVIAYSDKRVKENIKTIDNSLEKVNQLRGVEFNKIGEDKKSIGVIAQEIEKILPEVVREDDKGMKSVAYGNITGILIEAIKELTTKVERLENNKCNCK
jgi:hypothetical protein